MIGVGHDAVNVPVALGWDGRLIICGLIDALYVPAVNQRGFRQRRILAINCRVAPGWCVGETRHFM